MNNLFSSITHIRIQYHLLFCVETVIVLRLEVDREFKLLFGVEHVPAHSVKIHDVHLTLNLVLVQVEYASLGDAKNTLLCPLVLIRLLDFVREYDSF